MKSTLFNLCNLIGLHQAYRILRKISGLSQKVSSILPAHLTKCVYFHHGQATNRGGEYWQIHLYLFSSCFDFVHENSFTPNEHCVSIRLQPPYKNSI